MLSSKIRAIGHQMTAIEVRFNSKQEVGSPPSALLDKRHLNAPSFTYVQEQNRKVLGRKIYGGLLSRQIQ